MNSIRFLVLLGLGFFCVAALADLQVYPTRIVLSNKIRSGQVSLRHRGNSAMKYRVSAIFYKMNPDGSLVVVDKPDAAAMSAIPYMKFSPKVVTLAPNIEQVVRILYSVPKDAAEGEYRAHLYFEDMDELAPKEEKKVEANVAQMNLKARMAIAIPVILRNGDSEAAVSLEELKIVTLPDRSRAFSVEMLRKGNKNLYGDFRIFFKPQAGEPILIGTVNGVSSYIDKRKAMYPLQVPEKVNLKDGTLRAEFLDPVGEGGKIQASTEASL